MNYWCDKLVDAAVSTGVTLAFAIPIYYLGRRDQLKLSWAALVDGLLLRLGELDVRAPDDSHPKTNDGVRFCRHFFLCQADVMRLAGFTEGKAMANRIAQEIKDWNDAELVRRKRGEPETSVADATNAKIPWEKQLASLRRTLTS